MDITDTESAKTAPSPDLTEYFARDGGKTVTSAPVGHEWVSLTLVLLPAALGVAASAFFLPEKGGMLYSALSKNAAGYASVFSSAKTGLYEAFASAIMLTRADLAVFFLSLLFPYTAASRPLTALFSFCRTWLTAVAVIFAIGSLPAAASLLVGLPATYFMMYRADRSHERIRLRGAYAPYVKDLAASVTAAASTSGAVIALRTVIILVSGLAAGWFPAPGAV